MEVSLKCVSVIKNVLVFSLSVFSSALLLWWFHDITAWTIPETIKSDWFETSESSLFLVTVSVWISINIYCCRPYFFLCYSFLAIQDHKNFIYIYTYTRMAQSSWFDDGDDDDIFKGYSKCSTPHLERRATSEYFSCINALPLLLKL